MARGRNSMLEEFPEIREHIIKSLAAGNPVKTTCELTGVSEDVFYDALAKAESENAPAWAVDFAEKVKKAKAEFKAAHLKNIGNAAQKQWTASAWLLERLHSEEFARKDKLEHSGRVENVTLSTPAEIQANLQAILGDDYDQKPKH